MKKKNNLFIIAFLCFITLVGVTIAYFGSTAVLENEFQSAKYQTVTEEEFVSPTNWLPGQTIPKTITTTNEGTIPVRVRVKFEESWTSKNNNPLELTYNDENVAIINLDNEDDWLYKDGYYYYLKDLNPLESTSSLISGVTFNPNTPSNVSCTSDSGVYICESTGDGYDDAIYKLKIITETVQSDLYVSIWSLEKDLPKIKPIYCTYSGGETFTQGFEYVNGPYTYHYKQEQAARNTWVNIDTNGFGVVLTDKESENAITEPFCNYINDVPVVSASFLFDTSNAVSVDLTKFSTVNITNMGQMFRNSQFTSLDFGTFDTSSVTNMYGMFYNSQATSLDLSSFDTSKVTNMREMFYQNPESSYQNQVLSLDLGGLNTSNVTNMSYMFYGSKITSLDLSEFDTSKVTDMIGMFAHSQITTLDLSNFDTSNVTRMRSMFYYSLATSIDISSFDTSKVTDMAGMFSYSEATSLDLRSFNTSEVENMNYMFQASKVASLDLSSFDTSNVINALGMFENAITTTGYARTQADADRLNATSNKPSTLTFVVK